MGQNKCTIRHVQAIYDVKMECGIANKPGVGGGGRQKVKEQNLRPDKINDFFSNVIFDISIQSSSMSASDDDDMPSSRIAESK